MSRHPTSDWMNGIFNCDALFFKDFLQLMAHMLRLGHSHPITGNYDNLLCILEDNNRVFRFVGFGSFLDTFSACSGTRGYFNTNK